MSMAKNDEGVLDLGPPEMRARLEALYRHAQVGRCVNGVAHDINNFLGAALAYAELVSLDANLSTESKRMLGEVVKGVGACSQLVSTLTGVARKDAPNVVLIEPGELLHAAVRLVNYEFKARRVKLEVATPPGLQAIICDAPKIELALLYLLFNALEESEAQGRAAVRAAVRAEGDAVSFTVQCDGPPMPPEACERLFTPGYTKRSGAHLGLGLVLARRHAELHQGTLEYVPETGFVLRLWPGRVDRKALENA
jgi:signal transduction histidine kinase